VSWKPRGADRKEDRVLFAGRH